MEQPVRNVEENYGDDEIEDVDGGDSARISKKYIIKSQKMGGFS